jgi:transposase
VERNEANRAKFRETLESYPQYKLYFVDECGIDEFLYREYGYAPRGEPIYGKISGKKYSRTNIVAAKCVDKVIAPLTYKGTTDCTLFEYWFESMLLKSIPEYSVIVMDNASFHRKSKLTELAAKKECEVLFLPPYSPDLNLIEKFWSWLKSRLRKILPLFDNFYDALMDCFNVE